MGGRLPDNETTNDQDLYFNRWDAMADRLAELLSTDEERCLVIGFDPDFLMGTDKTCVSIPCWVAINLIKNVDGKLPWE
jgi:hypothetical protein